MRNLDNIETNKPSEEDVEDGLHSIKDSTNEKYLGDIICNSAKNDKNVEARTKKGYGIIQQIVSILQEISFGKYYFKVAKILRDSLFLNSILINSEAWYNMTRKNIEELEKSMIFF